MRIRLKRKFIIEPIIQGHCIRREIPLWTRLFDPYVMMNRDRVALVIGSGLVAWGIVALIVTGVTGKSLGELGGQILLAVAGGLAASLTAYFTTKN